jgi:two-component system chemotaxis sensor kinase CheA
MNYLETFDIGYLLDLYGENVIASMTDKNGNIQFVSAAYERISGYSNNELIGQKHNIVRHPDMEASVFKDLWKTILSGKVWVGEVKNLKKNGDFYWVNATVTPQFDADKNIIGYASIREDITDKKEATTLHSQIQNMLDTIEDGFLIFDKNMKIKDGYSKKCLEILGQNDICSKNITKIIFGNSEELQETFNFGVKELFNTNDKYTKELYLSLLPTRHFIKNKIFNINYKLLEDNEILVLIRDITKEQKLKKKILHEQEMQKMLLTLVTHKSEAIELIQSYEKFLKNLTPSYNKKKLKIHLHTFKGLFTQLEIVHTKDAIHVVEEKLKIHSFKTKMKKNLEKAFEKDVKVILDILGTDFLSPETFIKVNLEQLNMLEKKVENLIANSVVQKEELTTLRDDIFRLKDRPLYDMLNIYRITVENISKSIGKEVNSLVVQGDKKIHINENFKDFINSLVHIFRNSVVHGIEKPERREDNGKKRKGTILVNFDLINDNLVLQISDDGQGIDINAIKLRALELKLINIEKLNKLNIQEILQFIFVNEFSTIKKVDEMAGYGLGLASVKNEISKLQGVIEIINKPNNGLSFLFTIPYKQKNTNRIGILSSTVTTVVKKFLIDDIDIQYNNVQSLSSINFDTFSSMINLTGTNNIFCAISLDEKVLDKIYDVFTDGDNSDEAIELKKNLPDEIINIILGLSIQHFPTKYKQLTLSTPFVLESNIVETFIKNNQSSSIQIQTDYGNFEFIIILIE